MKFLWILPLVILGLLIGCPRKINKVVPQETREERIKKGEKLFKKLQCMACHSLFNRGSDNAPELAGVGPKYEKLKGSEKKAQEWFILHLEDPMKYPGVEKKKFPTSPMPSMTALTSKKDREDLALFLLSLRETREEKIKKGEKLFKKLQCLACHKLHHRGGSNAPELAGVGEKYNMIKGSEEAARRWFILHLEDPLKYPGVEKEKFITTKMPSMTKITTREDRNNIAFFLLSLKAHKKKK